MSSSKNVSIGENNSENVTEVFLYHLSLIRFPPHLDFPSISRSAAHGNSCSQASLPPRILSSQLYLFLLFPHVSEQYGFRITVPLGVVGIERGVDGVETLLFEHIEDPSLDTMLLIHDVTVGVILPNT